ALADGVRLVEEVVVQPQPGVARGGHVAFLDAMGSKGLLHRQRFEPRPQRQVGTAGVERVEPLLVKQLRQNRAVGAGIKAEHGGCLWTTASHVEKVGHVGWVERQRGPPALTKIVSIPATCVSLSPAGAASWPRRYRGTASGRPRIPGSR